MINAISPKMIKPIICPTDKTFLKGRITLEDYSDILTTKYCFARLIQPDIIVEIGVRCGYSAWAFLKGCKEGTKYFGIDANNGTHGGQGGKDGSYWEWAKKMLMKEHPNIQYDFKILDTQNVNDLDINISGNTKIILIHIDGDHTTKGVMRDMDLANKLHDNSGCEMYFLIDDIDYLSEVIDGVQYWLTDNKCKKYIAFKTKRGDLLVHRI